MFKIEADFSFWGILRKMFSHQIKRISFSNFSSFKSKGGFFRWRLDGVLVLNPQSTHYLVGYELSEWVSGWWVLPSWIFNNLWYFKGRVLTEKILVYKSTIKLSYDLNNFGKSWGVASIIFKITLEETCLIWNKS